MVAPTDQMIEAKAIILFYEDEFGNLEWIAENDAKGIRGAGDLIGRDMDRWENNPEHIHDHFRNRARAALEAAAAADACLSDAEQKAQAARCGCKGSDDYCPCQNAADRETIKARLSAKEASDG
jgi:hypothetical protein